MVDKGQKVVKPVYSSSLHDLEAHLCMYKKLGIYIIAQFLIIRWLKVDEYILLSNLSQNRGNCPTNSLPRVNRKTSRACASERARAQNSFDSHPIAPVPSPRAPQARAQNPCRRAPAPRFPLLFPYTRAKRINSHSRVSFAISIRARALGQALSFDKTILARAPVAQIRARKLVRLVYLCACAQCAISFAISMYARARTGASFDSSICARTHRTIRSSDLLHARAPIAPKSFDINNTTQARILGAGTNYFARVHSLRQSIVQDAGTA